MAELRDNATARRFEWTESGATAFATYRRDGTRLVIPHVEAPLSLRGTGAAGRLMEAMVEHARNAGIRLVPTCSYAQAWFKRHPEASDVLG
jgi:predicted GNAT family acetyltransferase